MIDLEKINRLLIKKEFMKTLVQYDEKKKIHKIQNDFMSFVKHENLLKVNIMQRSLTSLIS
jgi:hypothetical protein